jgi:para-nitrobenzyl esterase
VLPADEYTAFAAGAYNQVPVITGTNRDENKLFLYTDDAHVRQLFGLIPRLRDPENYQREASYLSRGWKANAVDQIAPLLLEAQGPSVYAYRFDWDELPTLFGSDLGEILGAAHAFEIPFVFGHFDLGRAAEFLYTEDNEASRQALSERMMSYWAEFAYSGDPGQGRDGTQPRWSPWDAARDADKYIVFDSPADGGVRMARETVSAAQLVAEVQSDASFESGAARCEMLDRLADWYDSIEVLTETGAVQLACAASSPMQSAAAGGE